MKRIVLFITSLSLGGAERQLCELADGLVEKGYEVTIVTFGEASDRHTYNSKVIRHHIAPGKSNIVKILAIWLYFLTVRADQIICFTQRACSYCIPPLLFRSRRKVRIIASERNTTVGNPSRQERLLMNFLYRRVDYIVPNSHAQCRHIIETKPQYASKTVAITNYTDTSVYHPTPLPINEIIRIGIFGRYDVQKNCMRFVEAVRILKEKSQQKFVIEWFGNRFLKDSQPNVMYEEMQQKVNSYGLEDCLVLNDFVKNVKEVLPRFDAICLPSLWEGFSNSISEAICCGKPCLVSDVADNGVMVKDGVNGFLFDPTNEEAIVNAFIKYFTLNNEDKQCMANASRKRAEELFDRNRFINSYVELIESK